METKEAIEFVKDEVFFAEDNYNEDIIKKRDEVISLLQQGEALKAENKELKAYKKIVEKFKIKLKDFRLAKNRKWTWTENEIHLLEKKYLKEERK